MVGGERREARLLAPVLALAGIAIVLVAVVGTASVDQRWWWAPDAEVPRDGFSHTVTLDGPGGAYAIWSDSSLGDPGCELETSGGRPIDTTFVPQDERVRLDEPWIAEPEASARFEVPRDGVVVATCDAMDATPVQVLHLAPLRPAAFYVLMQYGPILLGLVLLVGGFALSAAQSILRLREGRATRVTQ